MHLSGIIIVYRILFCVEYGILLKTTGVDPEVRHNNTEEESLLCYKRKRYNNSSKLPC